MDRIAINPLVDYAFKKLLGDPANVDILLDFLNAILKLRPPIARVTILNPFNARAFEADKLTVVDVKATDGDGRVFQVEVQLQVHGALPARALYAWARTYGDQLGQGDGYDQLRPTLAIWILGGLLFPDSPRVHHRFSLSDPETGLHLTDHIELHMLQLPRFQLPVNLDEEARWVYFLKEARHWTELPASLDSPALRKAMSELDAISDSIADRLRYLAREDYLREQITLENLRRQAEADLQKAEEGRLKAEEGRLRAEEGRLRAEAELAQVEHQRLEALVQAEREQRALEADRERLRERLLAAGIDPDAP